MPREPENFRDTLSVMLNAGVPLTMSPTKARTLLGVSKGKWAEIVDSGGINVKNKLVTAAELARYQCKR